MEKVKDGAKTGAAPKKKKAPAINTEKVLENVKEALILLRLIKVDQAEKQPVDDLLTAAVVHLKGKPSDLDEDEDEEEDPAIAALSQAAATKDGALDGNGELKSDSVPAGATHEPKASADNEGHQFKATENDTAAGDQNLGTTPPALPGENAGTKDTAKNEKAADPKDAAKSSKEDKAKDK